MVDTGVNRSVGAMALEDGEDTQLIGKAVINLAGKTCEEVLEEFKALIPLVGDFDMRRKYTVKQITEWVHMGYTAQQLMALFVLLYQRYPRAEESSMHSSLASAVAAKILAAI